MGLIASILRFGGAAREVGETVGGVAEVFVGNQAEREAAAAAQVAGAVGQFSAEFAHPGGGRFDGFVNGLNRLPRPLLALSTIGLFVYAMAAPTGFSLRMRGLALVPEPLWWLLGAIVSFYFGARELHHQRLRSVQSALPRIVAGVAAAAAPREVVRDEGVQEVAATPFLSILPDRACPAPSAEAVPAVSEPAVAERSRAGDPDWNPALEEWRTRAR